jgi:hypothetical protein
MLELKTFRVDFFEVRYMRLRVKARSAAEAIKKAEGIYIDNPDDNRVSMRRHDPFCRAQAKPVVTFADLATLLSAARERR